MEFIVAPNELKTVNYYKDYDHENASINAANVNSIKPGIEKWFPDNEGIPCIIFEMQGSEEPIKWLISKSKYGFKGATEVRDCILKQIENGNTKPEILKNES